MLPTVFSSCITQSRTWVYSLVTPSPSFTSSCQDPSGKRDWFFSYDQISPCITSCIKVPYRSVAQLFNRPLLFLPPQRPSFHNATALQLSLGLARGSPISANEAATVGMKCGSVVEFLPNMQRPRWTTEPCAARPQSLQ